MDLAGAERLSVADEALDKICRITAVTLGVRVSVVSLVAGDHQTLPGQYGLTADLEQLRRALVSPSFHQHTAAGLGPLVVSDARRLPEGRHNSGAGGVQVVAYAAMPLLDQAGKRLGYLWAVDTTAREWTSDQLSALADLSAMARNQLMLRTALTEATRARHDVEEANARLQSHSERLDLTLEASQLGSFEWFLDAGILNLDDRVCAIFGVDPRRFDHRIETLLESVLDDDVGSVTEAIERARRDGSAYRSEFRVRWPDGSVHWVAIFGRVQPSAAGRARMLGVARDNTHSRQALDQMAHLQEHMTDAFWALDSQGRFTMLNRQTEVLLGVRRDDVIGHAAWPTLASLVPSGQLSQVRAAVDAGQPADVDVFVLDLRRWYRLRVLPTAEGVAVYASALSPADSAAAAAEPAELTSWSRGVIAFSTALDAATGIDQLVHLLATRLLPAFGATGVLVALSDAGRMRIIGHHGYSDAAIRALDGVPLSSQAPIAICTRERRPLFTPSLDAYLAAFPQMRGPVVLTGKKAWAFLPLIAGTSALGSLTISFDEPREFEQQDRALLAAMAGQFAAAVELSRVRQLEHQLAAAVQHGMLPRELPALDEASVATRYLPATEGLDVGGDWYDVVPLPQGSVGLVIGDVQGHNVAAAATMGQLRIALRAYAAEGHDPSTVMGRTNRLMAEGSPSVFATCCYAVLDAPGGWLDLVLAGHPPPLLRRAHRRGAAQGRGRYTVESLEAAVGLPLGVSAEERYPVTRLEIGSGDCLLMFTDGLVEDRLRPIQQGIAQLAEQFAVVDTGDLDDALDALLAGSGMQGSRPDDVALILARVQPTRAGAAARVAEHLVDRAAPRAAARARRWAVTTLRRWRFEGDLETAILLTHELVTNALRHTNGTVSVRLHLAGSMLRVDVQDQSTTPPVPQVMDTSAESGRGVHLVNVLSVRWGVSPRGDGKLVWFELRAAP